MSNSLFPYNELVALKAEITNNLENRIYYDELRDMEKKKVYYKSLSFSDKLIHKNIQELLKATHVRQLDYKPHRYLYPWVDLQENGELKSLYSGEKMDPFIVIEQDLSSTDNNLLNCEHVVPQSWFDKKEPMRGDLHHLFACEPSCNSSRSNYPYFDFSDYHPEANAHVVRDGCGKSEEGKFEPEYGKGIVARATMYFMIRYHNIIDPNLVDISLLLEWHHQFQVSTYEKHRNLAIHDQQGNRNPLIDYPELAEKIVHNII